MVSMFYLLMNLSIEYNLSEYEYNLSENFGNLMHLNCPLFLADTFLSARYNFNQIGDSPDRYRTSCVNLDNTIEHVKMADAIRLRGSIHVHGIVILIHTLITILKK